MLRNLTKRALPSIGIWILIFATLAAGQRSTTVRSGPAIAAAKAQLDHGDLEAGEKTLWNILSVEPTNAEALNTLGLVRVRQQRYAEAEALFRRVLQLNPKSIVASQNLARSLLAQGKPLDAVQQYKQAIQIAPQDLELKTELAQLDFERGNFAEVLATLDSIKANALPTSTLPIRAASLLSLGRTSEAKRLIPQAKGSPSLALGLAGVFVDAHEPDAALRSLAFVNPSAKSLAARFYYLQGRALRQKGKLQPAMTSYRQALVQDPKSVGTQLAIAEILSIEGKHEESLAILEKVRSLHPDSTEILRDFIVEAMRVGKNDSALQASQDLQGKSSELDDRFLVASVMMQQKQYLAASHILEDYITKRPEDPKAFLGLGMAYLNLLRYTDARQALDRSLKLKPDLAETHYQLGILLAQQGNRQEAVASWQEAVKLQPGHAQALFSLGTIYLESGELDKALNAFLGSLSADPNNMKTEYDVALVLNKMGRSEESKKHFEYYRKMQEEEHIGKENSMVAPDHP